MMQRILLLLVAVAVTISSGRRVGLRDKAVMGQKGPFVLLYEHESFRGKFRTVIATWPICSKSFSNI